MNKLSSLPGPQSKRFLKKMEQVVGDSIYVGLFGLVMQSGDGVTITDVDGNSYLDCLSGASVSILGYADSQLPDVYKQVASRLQHSCFPYSPNPESIELAERLVELMPGGGDNRVLFGLSGSDSCDAAIKIARNYTNKANIISFRGDYHGSTGLSQPASGLGLGGNTYLSSEYFRKFAFPDHTELANQVLVDIEAEMNGGDVAAVLIEVIQGDNGVVVPAEGFVACLRELCTTYGALFIVDEVQSGMGRTGKFWAIEHESVVPDLLIAGKGLTAGYAAVSAVMGAKEFINVLKPADHLFSYSGHPPSCAVASAVIDRIRNTDIMQNAEIQGHYLIKGLKAIQAFYPEVIKEVRGRGLMIGMSIRELGDPFLARLFVFLCLKQGVHFGYFGPRHNVIRIQPPLTIKKEHCDEILAVCLNVAKAISRKEYSFADINTVHSYCMGWASQLELDKVTPATLPLELNYHVEAMTIDDINDASHCLIKAYWTDPKTQEAFSLVESGEESESFAAFKAKFGVLHESICRTITIPEDKGPSFIARREDGAIIGAIVTERYRHEYTDNVHPFSPVVTVPLEYAPVIDIVRRLEKQIREFYPDINDKKTLHLFTVGVEPGFRRQGISKALFKAVLDQAKEEAYDYIIAEASTTATQHSLTHHFGFEVCGEIFYDDYDYNGKKVFENLSERNNPLAAKSYQALVLKCEGDSDD